MITAADVARVASQTFFRSDVVERVLRLEGILERLDQHESARGLWVLKGGTALHLLHLDVPRLSVDIDLNFVGAAEVEDMQRMRPEFEAALAACCEREGCSVRRVPVEHAGGKLRLRYPSLLGGSQNLEVDVNYVARVPLWGIARIPLRFPPGAGLRVPTLAIEELAAGKFAALVQRSAARDSYDAACLVELMPDLTRRPAFRIALACAVGGSRRDIRHLPVPRPTSAAALLGRDLEPLLRRSPTSPRKPAEALAAWIDERVPGAVRSALDWSTRERRFLDRLLDEGEVDAAALSDDPGVQDRIRRQPMLVWKAAHVREHTRGN